ncbi:MAG: calcium/sodium antiporter [Pseudomonadota bacterium]|nr:calcium/sodium antiporter [Pseudomonadota bacterium]
MNAFALFGGGLVLLVFAAELIVRHGSSLALALGVQPVVLGLTLVAVGTSTPELAVGITAALDGSGGLAVGNITGAVIINILLILGASSLLRPLVLHPRSVHTDLPMAVIAAGLLAAFAWDGTLSRGNGLVMVSVALAYTGLVIHQSLAAPRLMRSEFTKMYGTDGARIPGTDEGHKGINLIYLMAGIGLSILGAHWLVDGAVAIARSIGIGEAVIGLTIVAMGTTAPELVTTTIGTIRNERDVAVGNLLGSSIYNTLLILGIVCIVAPDGIPVERELMLFDIPLMSAVALLCIPVFVNDGKISRAEGALFVSLYCLYLAYLLVWR